MQVFRGVGSPRFTSRYPSLRRLGAAAELWQNNPGRPGRRAAWWRRRASEEAGRGVSWSHACWQRGCVVSPSSVQAGEGPGPGVCVWSRVEGGGGALAVLQWLPGRRRLLTLALRCSRSWLPAGALTPQAPPGAALAPGAPEAGQQVAAASLPPKLANAA